MVREKWTGYVVGICHINDITQDQLAKKVGCSKQYLCSVLCGKRYGSPEFKDRVLCSLAEMIAYEK